MQIRFSLICSGLLAASVPPRAVAAGVLGEDTSYITWPPLESAWRGMERGQESRGGGGGERFLRVALYLSGSLTHRGGEFGGFAECPLT